MNEPDQSNLLLWIAGGIMSLVGWILRRHVGRMDEHEARINKLEVEKVDDARLEQTITRIEGKIDGIHRRIDEVVRPR